MNSKVGKWKIVKKDDQTWRLFKVMLDDDGQENAVEGLATFKTKQDAEAHLLKMGVGFGDRIEDK